MIPSLLRSRFSNTLESHQIDEDYSEANTAATASATCLSNSNSGQLTQQLPSPVMAPPTLLQSTTPIDPSTATTNPTNTNDLPFDPYEVVPSYEASQRMHNQGILTPVDDLTRPTQIYTPIPSLPMPQSMVPQAVPMTESTSSTESTLNNLIIPSSSTRVNMMKRTSIKQLGLKFLNARQHFLLAFCRDVSLIPPVIGLRLSYYNDHALNVLDNSPRGCEYFLTGLWCIVSAYLSYSILDSLLVRWIVTYLTSAAIVRVLSMLTIIITIELFLVGAFSSDSGQKYGLHIWLLISCFLTFAYIVQNFVTSNLEITSRKGIRKKARFFDFYNIVVFAVVPVGLASFVTMIGLLRSLLLLRMDIDQKLLT
ncbi:N-glycosylation protein EOS1 [Candida viswanathii]|uniref:N-glycosylation protein EOS1 n=1 Tax=Candida viswanathii TaxID=5486 RepID=A0A367YDA4_9ASCO|nr:N-glycosylation protein EOS1 [Candida viswanathii]